MELYLLVGCIGILLIASLYLYSKRGVQVVVERSNSLPHIEENIRFLERHKCKYEPNMEIKLHRIKNQRRYNDTISALEDKIYELNILFDKLRYTVERTKFGEFMTASDIFKFIIEEKDIEECTKYVNTKIDLKKEIKDFKSRKKEAELLLQNLLDVSTKMEANHKK